MRRIKKFAAGVSMALLLATGAAKAGSDLNEVGAFLVYPAILALTQGPNTVETYVSIINASTAATNAHISFINGIEIPGETPEECYECDFTIPLSGNDAELLVVRIDTNLGLTVIESEDRTVSHSCNQLAGFMTVSLEDNAGVTITSNVLLGSETIVDYTLGVALSIPAVPFQGKLGGNGNRAFGFDDVEYGKLPRYIAADFIAPDLPGTAFAAQAALVLFTLNFERQQAPLTDCSVTGYDAAEHPFSRSFEFGCWTVADLCDVSPEFCYPNLSATPCNPYVADPDFEADDECDTHGWLKLDCRVRQDPNEPPSIGDARGAVHGAIVQIAPAGTRIRRNDPTAPTTGGAVAWGRLLYQSVTTGDSVTLYLESTAPF